VRDGGISPCIFSRKIRGSFHYDCLISRTIVSCSWCVDCGVYRQYNCALSCLDFELSTLQRVILPTAFKLHRDLVCCILISKNSHFKILHMPRCNDEFFICVSRSNILASSIFTSVLISIFSWSIYVPSSI
jgi:hypothetical protein